MFWVGGGKSVFFLSEIYFWCIGMLWLANSYTEHERALIESKVQAFLDEMNQAATMREADAFSKQLPHICTITRRSLSVNFLCILSCRAIYKVACCSKRRCRICAHSL